ncbi:MAG: hypothetical protein AAF593_14605 [Planctomycetota bacterium]
MTEPDSTPEVTPEVAPEATPEPETEASSGGEPDSTPPATDAPVAVNSNGNANKPKKTKIVLCPYCGHAQQQTDKCSECGGLFEPLSRRATQIAMGPWMIRNKNHPFRPGCSYEVLVQMIEGGRVGPMTVLRGPTTRQFWSVARNVPGVAHLLGYCHACGAHVSKDDPRCPSCDAVFRPVKQRNEMGLQFPNRRAAEAAQRSLNRLLGLTPDQPEEAAETAALPEAEAESLNEDQAQVAAAAASAPSDQAPESIFEQDAKDPNATAPDAEQDLISDLLGDVAAAPTPRQPTPAATALDQAVAEHAPTVRAELPSPLQPGDPATPNPAALPPRREINWLVILLIALNVLVAAGIIAFVATQGGEG